MDSVAALVEKTLTDLKVSCSTTPAELEDDSLKKEVDPSFTFAKVEQRGDVTGAWIISVRVSVLLDLSVAFGTILHIYTFKPCSHLTLKCILDNPITRGQQL